MIHSLLCFAGGVATLAAATSASAAVLIAHPWIPAPPLGAVTASGFLTVTNLGPSPDVLIGGSTPAADALELHAMSMTGGIMRMRPMSGGLPLAANAAVTLTPQRGQHLMFVRLRRPMKPGDRVPVSLHFAKAGAVKAIFVVEAASQTTPATR